MDEYLGVSVSVPVDGWMNVWMEGITMRQQLRSHTHTLTHAAVPYYRFTSYTLYLRDLFLYVM